MRVILFPVAAVISMTLGQSAIADYPATPAAVSSLGAIAADGYLYIYGGHAGKTHTYNNKTTLGTFHRLKLAGGTRWEELASGPILQGTNLAAHGGKIYRVGGMSPRNAPGEPADSVSVPDAARFDPKIGKWEDLPPLPSGRSSHDVVVVGDKLVVVGGWKMGGKDGKSTWHDTALSLDLTAPDAKWVEIPQPFKRRALTAAVLGSKVYVLGGLTENGADPRVDILDVPTGKWSSGPAIPVGDSKMPAFSPAATTVGERIVIQTSAGGVFRLTADGKEWEKVGTAQKPRMVARLVPLSAAEVVLVGGAAKGGNVEEVEVIKLAEKGEKVPPPTPPK